MKLDLEFGNTIPENVTILEAVALVKVLSEDGQVTWYRISSESLNRMEALGMLRAAVAVAEAGLVADFIADDDEE